MKSGPNTPNKFDSSWFEVKDYPSGSKAQRRRAAKIARTAKRGDRNFAKRQMDKE